MSEPWRNTTYSGGGELALAPLRHPPLEQAIGAACQQLPIHAAYLAALRDPAQGNQPRLLLAVAGSDVQSQRRLAALIAELLPDDLELDLIELAEDSLSAAVLASCQPFYRRT